MELLNGIAGFLKRLFQWWFTVMPWEQAILVRKGKRFRILGPGMYLKLPFLDTAYIQTTRMRIADTPMQTISTKDNSTITIKCAIGYSIVDLEKLYNSLSHPETTLNSMTMGFIGEYVRASNLGELTPQGIEQYIIDHITANAYGLAGLSIRITTFAVVKTFRLIQDQSYFYSEQLNMEPKK